MGVKTDKLMQNDNTSSESFETWQVCSQGVNAITGKSWM